MGNQFNSIQFRKLLFFLFCSSRLVTGTLLFRGEEMTVKERDAALRETQKVERAATREQRQVERKQQERLDRKQARLDAEAAERQDHIYQLRVAAQAKREQRVEDEAAFAKRIQKSRKYKTSARAFASGRFAGAKTSAFYIKSVASPNFCLRVASTNKSKPYPVYAENQSVVLSPCDETENSLFSFDSSSSYIHPRTTLTFCMDFDRGQDGRPLTLSKCDQLNRKYQMWRFTNNSQIVNEESEKCLVKVGATELQQQPCIDSSTGAYFDKLQFWRWVPKENIWSSPS